jgi:outer membrane immunogenic protein
MALGAVAAASLALSGHQAAAGLVASPTAGSNSANASGWLAGAHAGYNWKTGNVVYGFETDLSKTNLDSRMNGGLVVNGPNPIQPTDNASTAAKIDWYGTLRGRLGITNGPFLLYGTAGLAYGNIGVSSQFRSIDLALNQITSTTRAGWVAGAGAEYLLRPDLSLTLAYQYVDLGNLSLVGAAGPSTYGTFTSGQSATAHGQFHTVTAGFSWHFPATGFAGWYAGGQAGGAWGARSNAAYSSTPPLYASDARLKRDIVQVGRRGDGLGIYSYRYLGTDTVFVGVMAQEVALIHPAAVVRDPLSGLLAVDYGAIGMELMTVSDDARL